MCTVHVRPLDLCETEKGIRPTFPEDVKKYLFLQSPDFLSLVERRRVKHSSFHLHEENAVLLRTRMYETTYAQPRKRADREIFLAGGNVDDWVG
jgi:hypothetical protein